MTDETLRWAVPLASALVGGACSFAVSWGLMRGRIAELAREQVRIEKSHDKLEERLEKHIAAVGHTGSDAAVGELRRRVDAHDSRFGSFEEKLDEVRTIVARIDARLPVA